MTGTARLAIFPVVHVQSVDQAQQQAALALDAGADGVYLIDHGSGAADLLESAFNAVTQRHPSAFIGLNFLAIGCGVDAFAHVHQCVTAGRLRRYPNALWVDDALPLTSPHSTHADVPDLKAAVPELSCVAYLGGVAFKYTRTYTDDPEQAATEASALVTHVDVVTTSGPGTGKPPSPEKLRAMKAAAGPVPLAAASGVDAGNIADLRPYLDVVLVASSIETQPYSGEFDRGRLAEIIRLAQGDEC